MTLPIKTRAAICADYSAGLTMEACAEKHSTSAYTVRGILISQAVPRRLPGPPIDPAQDKKLIEMYDSAGLTWSEIGRKLKIRPNEVTRRYNAAKVRTLLPDKIDCVACGGSGKVFNPRKTHVPPFLGEDNVKPKT